MKNTTGIKKATYKDIISMQVIQLKVLDKIYSGTTQKPSNMIVLFMRALEMNKLGIKSRDIFNCIENNKGV